ncbi:MAG: cation:proton antiporter [Dehalococcoidia bacterium]|jgi:CPA2 family monovalent cation:H+ antiporter-2
MEELTLVKDLAIIMMVAGGVTLLFRWLRQPVILGYLIAGVLIGPYTFPVPPVSDVHTISLLADIGIILVLFALGLEFSWDRIREVGFSVVMIGVIEITTMICLGYSLGRLMGWSATEAIFLGAALHISSSAIIVKILRDTGRLKEEASRLIVGILVVEDFAAIAIIALLSGMATTGTADFGDIGSLVLRLVLFIVVSLVFGAILVPRLLNFTSRFRSTEALLVISLGLCFAMALISNSLGLSVAAGAFLMGALIGDTKQSGAIIEMLTPVRQMFAALFFVTIGMLVNIFEFREFIVPALVVSAVFIVGKVVSNTGATFISGRSGRTSLKVGTSMPQMGEFSLVITKMGVDHGVVMSSLYPVIALSTALTSVTTPYIMRSVDFVARFLDRRSPGLLKIYVSRLADWFKALRATFTRRTPVALAIRHALKNVAINLLIVMVLISAGTFSLGFVDDLARLTGIRPDVIGLLLGFLVVMLCVPSFVIIWRNVCSLVDDLVDHMLIRRLSTKLWKTETLHVLLRDSIVILLAIFAGVWFSPLIIGVLKFGVSGWAIPVLLLAVLIYLVARSLSDIHEQLEGTFRRTLLGEEYLSTSQTANLLGIHRDEVARLARNKKLPAIRIGHRWYVDRAEVERLKKSLKSPSAAGRPADDEDEPGE